MYPITNYQLGLVICLGCWIAGSALSLNYSLILKSEGLANYHLMYSRDIVGNLATGGMIFLNNVLTGFILSVLGYFSFGFLSVMVSLYNGYIFGILINGFVSKYAIGSIYLVFLHAPTELLALCILGAMGLKGFGNINKLLVNKHNGYFESFPGYKALLLPLLLLFISAFIESDLLFNLIC